MQICLLAMTVLVSVIEVSKPHVILGVGED